MRPGTQPPETHLKPHLNPLLKRPDLSIVIVLTLCLKILTLSLNPNTHNHRKGNPLFDIPESPGLGLTREAAIRQDSRISSRSIRR